MSPYIGGFIIMCIIALPTYLIEEFGYKIKWVENNKAILIILLWLVTITFCYFILMPIFGIKLLPSAFQY